jgi:hypothetical protein
MKPRNIHSASQIDWRREAEPDECPICGEAECDCDGLLHESKSIADAILEAALEREDSEAECPDGFDGG